MELPVLSMSCSCSSLLSIRLTMSKGSSHATSMAFQNMRIRLLMLTSALVGAPSLPDGEHFATGARECFKEQEHYQASRPMKKMFGRFQFGYKEVAESFCA